MSNDARAIVLSIIITGFVIGGQVIIALKQIEVDKKCEVKND